MTGPVVVAGALLVWAALAKAARPAPMVGALAMAGLPVPASIVRTIAAGEAVVGAGAVLVGGRPFLVAMAASYAAFTAFVAVAVRRGWPLASCGCFGSFAGAGGRDAPPARAHVAADAALAVASFVGAVERLHPLSAMAHRPAQGVAIALVATVTALLLALVMTALPKRATR